MSAPAYHATVHEDGRLEVHHPPTVKPTNVPFDAPELERLRGQLAREEDAATRWAAVAVDYQRLARTRGAILGEVRADLLALGDRLRAIDLELAVEVLELAAKAGAR